MNKFLIAAMGAAVAAASVSVAASDAQGAFFINAGVGQAQYHMGRTDGLPYRLDDKDTAGALRFGYAWRTGSGFDLGIEGGYADLGKTVLKYGDGMVAGKSDFGTTGWMLGANGKYHLDRNWFLSARAGWLHAKDKSRARVTFISSGKTLIYSSDDGTGDGWYGGLGVGYDFAPSFSLSLNYDNYHARARLYGVSGAGNVGAYTIGAEFRF